jgi:hypothetical protein
MLLLAEAQAAAGEPPEEEVLSLLRALRRLQAGQPGALVHAETTALAPPPETAAAVAAATGAERNGPMDADVDSGTEGQLRGKARSEGGALGLEIEAEMALRGAIQAAARGALEAAVSRLPEDSRAAVREGGEQVRHAVDLCFVRMRWGPPQCGYRQAVRQSACAGEGRFAHNKAQLGVRRDALILAGREIRQLRTAPIHAVRRRPAFPL